MVQRIESSLRLINDAAPSGEGWWTWSVWVEGEPDDLDQVESVTYRLHPTFPTPIVRVTDRETHFKLGSAGWGEFAIRADAQMKDGRRVPLERWLELERAETRTAPGRSGPSVFVSHSVADTPTVLAFCEALQQQGIDVWTAEKAVEAGDSTFPRFEAGATTLAVTISRRLEDADVVVAIFSDPPSRFVEQEALTALEHGRYVIPVVIERAQLPGRLASIARLELSDRAHIGVLADQVAARIKDRVIPEETT